VSRSRDAITEPGALGQDPSFAYSRLWEDSQPPDLEAFLAGAGDLTPVQLAGVLEIDLWQRWQHGQRILAEHYLQAYPAVEADPECAIRLVYAEFLQRERQGEAAPLPEYEHRFPALAARLKGQVELHRALAATPWQEPLSPSGDATGPEPEPDQLAATTRPLPRVPGYEVQGELGRGGMGIVYRARHLRLKRLVALKMIRPGAQVELLARFRVEAEAVARLQHPNIVQIFEVGEHDALPFLALELVEGGSLAQRLRGTPVPPGAAARLVETLARAMHYAHARGVVHRNLKPANILLQSRRSTDYTDCTDRKEGLAAASASVKSVASVDEWLPKITDFGLAKQLEDDSGQTQSGAIIGTPSYMAPEQAAGQPGRVTPAADVYALGAILYELLTGRPPFRGASPLETLEQVRSQEPVPPSRLQPRLPRDLGTICQKCLEKQPGSRYADAGALAGDLARFSRGEPVRARPISQPERAWRWCRRNPLVAALLAALIAVLVGGLAGVTWKWREADRRRLEAEEQRRQASALAAAEQAARQRAERLVAELSREYFHKGLVHLEQGKSVQGMLELARALEIAPDNEPALRHVIRANLAGWQGKLPVALRGLMRGRPPRSRLIYPPPVGDVAIYAACFSPDGRTLATGGDDCVVQLWDVATGQPLGQAFEHPAAIRSLAFSPDGRTILSGGFPAEARLWDVRSGKLLANLAGHRGDIDSVVFRPDSKAALTASADGTVRYWDTTTGQLLKEPLTHPDRVAGVALRSDSQVAATACKDHLARLWDLDTGKVIGKPLPHPDEVTAVAFSPDGSTLLTGCKDGAVCFWDLARGMERGRPLQQSGRLIAVGFRRDGRVVLTCGHERTASLWDAGSGRVLGTLLPTEPGDIRVAAFSPDGTRFVTAGMDGVVRLWETPPLPEGEDLAHENWVSALAFSPDGKVLLTGSACLPFPLGKGPLPLGDGEARLWDVRTRQPLSNPLPHEHMVMSVAFNPDGSRFLTGAGVLLGAAGEFQLWDTARRAPVRNATKLPATVYAVCFDPTGRTFVVGGGQGEGSLTKKFLSLIGAGGISGSHLETRLDPASGAGIAVLYETESERRVREFPHPLSWVSAAAFTPDGKLLLTGEANGLVHRWNVATGAEVGSPFSVGDSVLGIAVSPDGTTFLTGTGNGSAKLWSTETGAFTGKAFLHKGWIRPVAFSPRDPTVVTAGSDRVARLWDLATAEPIGPALEHQDGVGAVAFSPDGQWIVTAGAEKRVRFWEAPRVPEASPERQLLWLQLRTGMELSPDGELHRLDPRTWQERRRLLDKLGDPSESQRSRD
jgi:WD40 repeat protein/serine/threonine protein kinase